MTVIKHVGVMTRQTDWTNRDELCALIRTYFHPTKRSMRILEKAIWNPPMLDDAPAMGWDNRIWWKIPMQKSFDAAYKSYRDHINYYFNRYETSTEVLRSYDTWQAGRFEGQKLFKYLLKNSDMEQRHIETITSQRVNKKHIWLVISNNPTDLFMMSSGQSFSSCMGLNSPYSGAYYMGLPGLLVEPSKYLIFAAPGKLHETDLNGFTQRHLKYLQRHISHWAHHKYDKSDKTFGLVKPYPGGKIDIPKLIRNRKIPARMLDWQTEKHRVPRINTSLGYEFTPYEDNVRSKRYGHDVFFTSREGGSSPNSLSFKKTFSNMGTEFMKLGYEPVYCSKCHASCKPDTVFYHDDDEPFCRSCWDAAFYRCSGCGAHHPKTIPYSSYPQYRPDGILEEMRHFCDERDHGYVTKYCSVCNCAHHRYGGGSFNDDWVCYNCIPKDNRMWCECCNTMHRLEDGEVDPSDNFFCYGCLQNYVLFCTFCKKPHIRLFVLPDKETHTCRNCLMTARSSSNVQRPANSYAPEEYRNARSTQTTIPDPQQIDQGRTNEPVFEGFTELMEHSFQG